MKIPKIADAINNIDEDLVVAAMEDKKKIKRKGIVKWSIAVAASLLIVAAGFFAAGKLGLFDGINAQDSPKIKVVDIGDTALNTGKDTNSLHDSRYLAAVYKEQTIPQALKAYTLSYPKTPQRPSRPKYTAYDSDGDGRLNEEEQEVFLNSISEWSEFAYKKGMVEEYDQVEAKNELLSFSTKTMTQLLKENDHENRVFSPINIYIALGMLAETTAGNTRQQILDLLGVSSIEDVRILMKGLYNNAYYDEDLKSVLASSADCQPIVIDEEHFFYEDFSDYDALARLPLSSGTGVVPVCWERMSYQSPIISPKIVKGTTISSLVSITLNSSCLQLRTSVSASGNTSYAVLPGIATDLSTLEVGFSTSSIVSDTSLQLSFGYLTDTTYGSVDFIEVASFHNSYFPTDSFTRYEVQLNGIVFPENARLAFKVKYQYSIYYSLRPFRTGNPSSPHFLRGIPERTGNLRLQGLQLRLLRL